MAHSVTHTFVSPVADDSDPNEVGPDEWNAAHTVTLDADELLASIKTVDGTGSGLDADTVDGNEAAALLARANHTGTQAASTISDFDTEVSNNTDVAANTAARHDAVTVTDSSEINFTLTGQDITAALVAGSIDETKLDTSVNASLDLADSALQSSDIGTSVQAWDAQLDSLSSASANGVSLVTAANYAAMRGLLDLEAGTDFYSVSAADAAFQPLDSDLTAIAGLSRTRGDLIRGGASAWERYALGTSGYALKSDGTDAVWAADREVLTANRTYYVRTDGSDSNDGLTNNSGGAFLTVQKAINTTYGLDLNGYDVTIQIADGTYATTTATNLAFTKPFVGGNVTIQGNTTTPTNVVLSTTTAPVVDVATVALVVTITGVQFDSTSGTMIACSYPGCRINLSLVDFASTSGNHINLTAASVITFTGNYTVSGGANVHWGVNNAGSIFATGRTVTISAAVTINFWVYTYNAGTTDCASMTFTNKANVTGTRYSVTTNAVVQTNGGGATYLPGTVAGSTGTGGQYA